MIGAPPVSLGALAPTLVLLGAAIVVLLLDLLPPRDDKTHLAGVKRLFVDPLAEELGPLGTSLERLPDTPDDALPPCEPGD